MFPAPEPDEREDGSPTLEVGWSSSHLLVGIWNKFSHGNSDVGRSQVPQQKLIPNVVRLFFSLQGFYIQTTIILIVFIMEKEVYSVT